ncbi:MAG TPA: glucosyl-3-phosphoglycerate synthase, partial [Miltoncostaea sp.]|nr:glucosyl-3-phosphoglycerate synthase [Miltoncostaea sp.]
MTGPLPPPEPSLRACVVVPARDEEDRIADCIAALAAQEGVPAADVEVILVLDRCTDATADRALTAARRHAGLRLRVLASEVPGAGAARRRGMDEAAARLEAVGRPGGLIASTDADSLPRRDWLRRQLDLVAGGAQAVGGFIEVDAEDELLRRRALRLETRGEATGGDGHPFFSGASMGLTVGAYRAAGGLRPLAALEDQALEQSLRARGIPIVRSRDVRVVTSGRTEGRARHGLAADLRLDDWATRRSYRAADWDAEALAARKRGTVSVILPAREVADTIGPIIDAIAPLERLGLVDELLVVDAASRDGTARIARAHGARVVQEADLLADAGPCQGKGDAMWRGLAATEGDVVAYLDADTADFRPSFVTGLLGPLIDDPGVALVKGAFRRPLLAGDTVLPDEGGRVTELVARPLLAILAPELGGLLQPLAGEQAARRDLLEAIPFPVGYGIETSMLLDALALRGLDAIAQVDLGTRQNRHQPLRELGAMAMAVMGAGLRRGLPAGVWEAFAAGRMRSPAPGGG